MDNFSFKSFKADEEWVSTTNLRFRFVSRGKGKPVILLHPFGYSIYTWRHIFDKFSDGYKIYAYDLKGFGNSDKPLKTDYSLETYVQELVEIMNKLGIKKCSLVGHALGGGIAIHAAVHFPCLFEKLILIDALSYVIPNPPLIFRVMRIPVVGEVMMVFNNVLTTKLILKEIFYNKALVTDELAKEYYRPFRDKGAANAYVKVTRQCFHPLRVQQLEKKIPLITQSTLVVWGKEDKWLPLDMAYRLNKEIPRSELCIISECGHFPQEEKPNELISKINEFLS